MSTPDKCPHCGSFANEHRPRSWVCGTFWTLQELSTAPSPKEVRSELCRERAANAQMRKERDALRQSRDEANELLSALNEWLDCHKGELEAAKAALARASMSNVFATGTELRVCHDIGKRQDRGLRKYGVSVEANPLNLRQWLQHAYEETLDQAIYLRRAIDEMDALISPQGQSPNGSVPPEHKKQGPDRDRPIRKFSEPDLP